MYYIVKCFYCHLRKKVRSIERTGAAHLNITTNDENFTFVQIAYSRVSGYHRQ